MMDRRAFLGRTTAAAAAAWTVPAVLSMDPVAAAAGSCSTTTVYEFSSGLEGWTVDNSFGSGTTGFWKHNNQASRDGGSLHYGNGTSGNFRTGNSRNSGRVYSPELEIPSSGPNTVRFTVWREVEVEDPGYDRLRLRILGSPNQTLYQVSSIGDTSGFETYTIAIPSTYNGDTVRFQFDFDTIDGNYNDYEGVYIGRFEASACPPVAAAAFGAQSARSAQSVTTVDDDPEDEPAPPRR
ncbi:MAG: hypothetical protein RIB98_15830 [Acidimicrobiales bacterium]